MLHAICRAEKQDIPVLFRAEELEKLLPQDFLKKIENMDRHFLALKDIGQQAVDLKQKGVLTRLFHIPVVIGKLLYHGRKFNQLGVQQTRFESFSDDPNIPHTYVEMFYNSELNLPFIEGKEQGCLDFKIGSFTIGEDGSHKTIGTDYDECRLNLTIAENGITSGSLNLFRSVGMFISQDTDTYVSDKDGQVPSVENFSAHAKYVLSVVKDTAEGKFHNLREDRFKSWGSPDARDVPDGLKPILFCQAVTETWSGNPLNGGPGGL